MTPVADLLRQSRASHVESFTHRGRITREGTIHVAPQLQHAGSSLQAALSLRLDAHGLDPQHADPAWLEDTAANKGIDHEALVTFYGRYLSPPPLAEIGQDSHAA